ncbi:Hypothetical protein CINCED_3A019714 [Cinara cedri]|uniref:DRBM domain-containing protein n=1 Tax=Cinara cedri TaxID=506608 RepID=A0A5E4M366_9HEMI|nr:Hypothetical protein CINCED_3A019714 [Cinara cedri]
MHNMFGLKCANILLEASPINSIITKPETNQSVEGSNEEKQDVKWLPKRKLNKKEQKKRLNARMRRLVCPKSPLMVFSELYKDVPIKLDEQIHDNCIIFTASIEIDGQVYTGDHVSKTQAKQKACENFLRLMLSKKISEPTSSSDKKEEGAVTAEDTMDVDSTDNSNSVKSKGPPQEDFPWPHFASLAMHNLISHWDLQPAPKSTHEVTSVRAPLKVGGMKKFPTNPENYNPVQLLHQMSPGIKFNEIAIATTSQSRFEASCEMNGVTFKGQGPTKKAAKRESAIAAIKYVWGFDFNSVEKK